MRRLFLKHLYTGTVLLAAGLSLIACDNGAQIGSTVKGTRIAVLESSKTITPDPDMKDTHPQLSGVVNNAAWPQAGYDAVHVIPNANLPDHVQEAWRADIGDGSDSDFKLIASPMVSHGHAYTMDSRGVVNAFDTKSGDNLWTVETAPADHEEDTMGGGIGVDGDTVYATTGFGEVLALSVKDGKVLWRHSLMNPIHAAPTIADGRVYAVTIDNELSALDARTGEVLWTHHGISEPATLMGASNPAVVGDSVVVTYSSGEIYELRTDNGRVSWNYGLTATTQQGGAMPAIADIRGLPVIDRDHVFAISHSGRMATIDHRTGDRDWEADIGGVNTPVVSGDTVFVLSNDNQLVALARESGRVIWAHQLQEKEDPTDKDSDPLFWAGPVLADRRLLLTNSLGQVVMFLADTGSPLQTIDVGDPSFIPPIVADNTIYVVTDNGELVALR
jgi:outer membrane protein assembly factor BamB